MPARIIRTATWIAAVAPAIQVVQTARGQEGAVPSAGLALQSLPLSRAIDELV
jgi:hypothetical protein